MKEQIWKSILIAVICLAVGAVSGITTSSNIPDWYVYLNKPSFNPPDWVFAPVWTTLYILMGISAGVIWTLGTDKREVRKALSVFSISLVLNAVWTQLFFGLRNPELAFIEILLLLTSILIYTYQFYKLKKWTAYLQIPYILWVSFATLLTLSIAVLN